MINTYTIVTDLLFHTYAGWFTIALVTACLLGAYFGPKMEDK